MHLPPLYRFALLALWASSAQAWGPEGHRIVAHLAELRLSDHARTAVADLLSPGERISDNRVCNWPDYIRHDQPETAPWHFVDIPFGATGYDPARDCTNGQCIVEQIGVLTRTLADTEAAREERRRALCFLVHLLADLHQPLHCISRDEDRGGNLRTVRLPNQPKDTNLHAVWDMNLVRASLGTNDPLAYAEGLNQRVTLPDAAEWGRGSVTNWAWASHQLAVTQSYAGIPPVGDPPCTPDAKYLETNRLVVEQQLMKAGVRLAAVLNKTLP